MIRCYIENQCFKSITMIFLNRLHEQLSYSDDEDKKPLSSQRFFYFFSTKRLRVWKKFVFLQRQNPPRFPKTSEPGRVFFLPMGTPYTKQPISIADQIARLKSLGLIIADEAKAEKTLGEVSY